MKEQRRCSANFPSTTLYYNLARMITGKLDASGAALAFFKYARMKEDILDIGAPWLDYIFEFCRMKEWTEALDLNNRVGPALDRSTDWYNSHLIRTTINIKRYRVEASKRPKLERNKMSLSLHKHISIEICKAWKRNEICKAWKRKNHVANEYNIQCIYLLHAQWLYLNQHGTFISETAVDNIVKPKENISPNAHLNSCSKCAQEAQRSETTQLCSSCRDYTFSLALATLVQKRLGTISRLRDAIHVSAVQR